MANATTAAPSMEAQISAFRGLSTEDGNITGVNGAGGGGAEHGEHGAEGDNALNVDDGGEGAPPPTAGKPKPKSAQERIDQAVKRQREAERKLDQLTGSHRTLEARLAAIEAGKAPGQQTPLTNAQQPTQRDPNAPDPTDTRKYQYGELDARYIADVARYEAQKVIDADRQQRDQQTRSQQAQATKAKFEGFIEKSSEKYADFRQTVIESAERNEWPLTQTLGELIVESEHGADIAYHLATNPADAERLAKLTPAKQAAWFGAQEARYSATSPAATRGNAQEMREPPARMTQAPPVPVTRLRGNSGNPSPVAPDTQDFAAFERLAMKRAAN